MAAKLLDRSKPIAQCGSSGDFFGRQASVEISVKTLVDELASAIDRVASEGERVVLTRKRKGVAALVSMDDLAALQRLEDEYDLKASRKVKAEMIRKGEKPIPLAEIKKRLEDEADVKAARKARKEKGGITLDQYCKKHGL